MEYVLTLLDKFQVLKYSKYFGMIIRANGAPHLNRHQLQRMMNIVVAESRIDAIHSLKITSTTVFQKINSNRSKIEKLTKGLSPENLFREMIELSSNY